MKKLLVYGALGAVVAGLVFRFFPNDERAIRRHLDGLAGAVTIRSQDSALKKLAGANRAVEFFTADAEFLLQGVEVAIHDRNDLREALLAARGNLRDARFEFADVHVKLPSGKQAATVFVTALAYLDGQTNALAHPLKLGWRKQDRRWLIARVESVGPAVE